MHAQTFARTDSEAVAPRRQTRPPSATRAQGRNGHLVNQEIFRTILFRERKRADRSDTAFSLLLIGIDGNESPATLRDVIGALSATKRQTDLLGWFEKGRVVGLILPETGVAREARRAIETRVRGELVRRLDPESLAHVSLSIHSYPVLPGAAGDDADDASPLPADLQSGRTRLATALAKRALDVVASAALLLLLAPVLLVIAALVRLTSKGPIFFRQIRVGQEARNFTMLKFRTMSANADHKMHRLYMSSFINGNGQRDGSTNGLFKMAHDPRITPVGRVLRKTSLDELPQFINVLRGEMSLVGPRPPVPYEVEQYKTWHRRRVFDAKPGITGLWQVTGRSRTTFDEMVRLDLRYARTPSVWTDIKILLATPRAVVSGKGAC